MKKDIETLAREAFSHDTQQPPASAWEAISSRLSEPLPSEAPRRPRRRRWPVAAALTLVGAVAALWLWWPQQQGSPAPEPAEVALCAQEPAARPAPPASEPRTLPQPAQPSAPTPAAAQPRPSAAPAEAVPSPIPVASQMAALPAGVPAPSAPAPAPAPVAPSAPAPAPAPAPVPPTPAPAPMLQAEAHRPEVAEARPASPRPVDTLRQALPNFISPNGDGDNDCFVIHGIEHYQRIAIEIYNSRSQRVYKTSHYENGFCGDGLPDGTYFYVVRFYLADHSSTLRRGTLLLRR